jgi:hypothetical protein
VGKIKPIQKIYSADQDLMKVQDSVANAIEPLTKIPLLEARIIKDVSLTTSVTAVDHGLGREPLGFFVVDSIADVRVWRSATPSIAPAKLLMLVASSAAVVNLIVF